MIKYQYSTILTLNGKIYTTKLHSLCPIGLVCVLRKSLNGGGYFTCMELSEGKKYLELHGGFTKEEMNLLFLKDERVNHELNC